MQKTQLESIFGGIGQRRGKFVKNKVNRSAADADDNAIKGDQNQQMSGNSGK